MLWFLQRQAFSVVVVPRSFAAYVNQEKPKSLIHQATYTVLPLCPDMESQMSRHNPTSGSHLHMKRWLVRFLVDLYDNRKGLVQSSMGKEFNKLVSHYKKLTGRWTRLYDLGHVPSFFWIEFKKKRPAARAYFSFDSMNIKHRTIASCLQVLIGDKRALCMYTGGFQE